MNANMAADLVLLTGATGMIGYRVLVQLLESGYQVRVAVRSLVGYEKVRDLKPTLPYSAKMSPIVVSDITAPGAYDDAVKGVNYIIHVASPLAANLPDGINGETEVLRPAIQGTIGILESANKATGVKRIVITASFLSIIGLTDIGSEATFDETHRTTASNLPLVHKDLAYVAAKVRTHEATYQWVKDHKPLFDVINIEPVFVIGRDDTVTDPSQITKGTNGLVMAPLLGLSMTPFPGATVHLDDVASIHVRSLDPSVPGNQDFLANSHPPRGIEWARMFDIVGKRYPKECAEGIFKVDVPERPQTQKINIDSSKAERTFSMTFKSFEEQVISVVDHYLELLGRRPDC